MVCVVKVTALAHSESPYTILPPYEHVCVLTHARMNNLWLTTFSADTHFPG